MGCQYCYDNQCSLKNQPCEFHRSAIEAYCENYKEEELPPYLNSESETDMEGDRDK